MPFTSYNLTNHSAQFGSTNITYPFTFELTMHANGFNDRYHYIVRKNSEAAQWQLIKAWLTDTNMVVVKEYPVPQTTNGP
jgi:hypothetical protein